jgi:hypothetical protein
MKLALRTLFFIPLCALCGSLLSNGLPRALHAAAPVLIVVFAALSYPLARVAGQSKVLEGLALLAWLPAALLVYLLVHTQLGTSISRPEECGRMPLAERWTACAGRDHSFLQGRLRYLRADGSPNAALCRAFLATHAVAKDVKDKSPCPQTQPERWSEVACAPLHLDGFARCFRCDSFRATGDTDYEAFGVDQACSKIAVLHGTNVKPEDIENRLKRGGLQAVGF